MSTEDKIKVVREKAADGIKFATVGAIGTVIGALLGLRIYAGIPERVQKLEDRADRNDARWVGHESWGNEKMIQLTGDMREMKVMLREMAQRMDRQKSVP